MSTRRGGAGQLAILKGWVDRIWVRDIAFDLPPESNRVRACLRIVRRLVAVTSHGSSELVNAVDGEAGTRAVPRTLRSVCHPLARTAWLAMYGVDTSMEAERAAIVAKVARRLS